MSALRTLDVSDVRRLVISRQHLSGAPVPTMLDVVRDIGCLQLDPISAVQRSHLLVLWSRLGQYDMNDIDRLIYQDKQLFEYWAHVASIVASDDYPIFSHWMRKWPDNVFFGANSRAFFEEDANSPAPLQTHILERLRSEGPLTTRHFEKKSDDRLKTSGWTSPDTVNRMFGYLWHAGKIMVARRQGTTRYWDLAERCLPENAPRDEISESEVVQRAAQKAIRALGVATPKQIIVHYTRHRYPDLPNELDALEKSGLIEQVQIQREGKNLSGKWYLHRDDVPLLEQIQAGNWQPKTTLLSPFDNLICDRDRLTMLFNFDFKVEIYVPQNKRIYGYYVLSILHGDRLIGRIDSLMDRKAKALNIREVFMEKDAPTDAATVKAVRAAIDNLGTFLGAKAINIGTVPDKWGKLQKQG